MKLIYHFCYFRYYLEPASPLKSINSTPSMTSPSSQQQPSVNGSTKSSSSNSSIQSDSLAILKSIQLTPPSANNRQHRTHHLQTSQNGNAHENGSVSSNNNFFTNHLNGTTNGSSHNGNEFVADFRKVSIYNSNNSLNSTGSGGGQQGNGKITNGISETNHNNGDLNANFADFENNKIYNAAGECYDRVRTIRKKINYIFFLFFSFCVCHGDFCIILS